MWGGTGYTRSILRIVNSFHKLSKNKFMSVAFKCEMAWDNRLQSPLLQKVNLDDLFYEIETKFSQSKVISAIDVDIFVNAINNASFLDEMEEIVHRLRMSKEATNIFPSTHHAFIRTYLTHGDSNELMRILNDRLNYGIFPDYFCYILLMDYFIEKGDFKNAAKVAVLQMLQEDFPNDLLKYMSLFSSYKYLLNPTEWEELKEEGVEQDDGEEIKVRVKYLRNPFFDNHFDLREPHSLIGKTYIMIAKSMDNSITNDVLLLGHCLLKEWNIVKDVINNVISTKQSISETTLKLAEEIISNITNEDELKNDLYDDAKKGLNALRVENLVANVDLLDFLETKIKEKTLEGETLSQEQIKVYKEWENCRDTSLREEIKRLSIADKLEKIKMKKKELVEKEQEIFFFERENELDLTIEKKKLDLPSKQSGKKNKNIDDLNYVPPEITKKRPSA